MAELSVNMKLEEHNPEELQKKLTEVVELIRRIQEGESFVSQETVLINNTKEDVKNNRIKLRALEKELGFRVKNSGPKPKAKAQRKPRSPRKTNTVEHPVAPVTGESKTVTNAYTEDVEFDLEG